MNTTNVKNWIQKAGVFARDIFVAFLGSELSEDKKPKTPQEMIGLVLRDELLPDREDLFKELDRMGSDGAAIQALLDDANINHNGIVIVNLPNGRTIRRTENWVVSRLLDVKKKKDREWTLARMSRLLEEHGDAAFIARLEILNNNWYAQYPRLFAEWVKDVTSDTSGQKMPDWLENLFGRNLLGRR